jgi:broad specificity phosphatase PhoE
MAIFLVRHGETDANVARIFQLPDATLSARGVAQAARLAARLAQAGVAAIACSDYARALATAEPIRVVTGAPLAVWPELRERNLGALRGRRHDELGDVDPFAPGYTPPGGESGEEFHARVARAWARVVELAAATAGNLVVVTHALVCRALVGEVLGLRAEAASALWRHTSLTVIAAAPPHGLELVDSIVHLDDLPPARA